MYILTEKGLWAISDWCTASTRRCHQGETKKRDCYFYPQTERVYETQSTPELRRDYGRTGDVYGAPCKLIYLTKTRTDWHRSWLQWPVPGGYDQTEILVRNLGERRQFIHTETPNMRTLTWHSNGPYFVSSSSYNMQQPAAGAQYVVPNGASHQGNSSSQRKSFNIFFAEII